MLFELLDFGINTGLRSLNKSVVVLINTSPPALILLNWVNCFRTAPIGTIYAWLFNMSEDFIHKIHTFSDVWFICKVFLHFSENSIVLDLKNSARKK